MSSYRRDRFGASPWTAIMLGSRWTYTDLYVCVYPSSGFTLLYGLHPDTPDPSHGPMLYNHEYIRDHVAEVVSKKARYGYPGRKLDHLDGQASRDLNGYDPGRTMTAPFSPVQPRPRHLRSLLFSLIPRSLASRGPEALRSHDGCPGPRGWTSRIRGSILHRIHPPIHTDTRVRWSEKQNKSPLRPPLAESSPLNKHCQIPDGTTWAPRWSGARGSHLL